jgi:hypothetical protein
MSWSQAIKSTAIAAAAHRAWLVANSRESSRPRPMSSLRCGYGPPPVRERGDGPPATAAHQPGCRYERGVTPAVAFLEQGQLCARVRAFPPHDHPHPVRPTGQVKQSGQLGDLRTLADLAVSVDRL